jgi:hypothetical protein
MSNSTLRTLLAGEQDWAAVEAGKLDWQSFGVQPSIENATTPLIFPDVPRRTGYKPYSERQRARLLREGSHLGLHEHGIASLDSSETRERWRQEHGFRA